MATRAPKYPFPTHVNVTNFVTLKLTEDNFLLWQTQVLRFLRSQRLLGFITGEVVAPNEFLETGDDEQNVEVDNPDYLDWLSTDQLISSWLSGTVSESILGLIIGIDNSYELWQALLNRFTHKSIAREFELKGKLQACVKRDRSLSEYLSDYKLICDQLNAIGKPVDPVNKMFGVLEGLGPEYEGFRTTMYCLSPQPKYDEMIAQLVRFDSRLQTHSVSQVSPHLAYFGQRRNDNFQNLPPAQVSANQRGGLRGGRFYGRGRTMNNRGRSYGYPGRGTGSDSSRSVHSGQGFRPYTNPAPRYPGTTSAYPALNTAPHKPVQGEQVSQQSSVVCQLCKRAGHDALSCVNHHIALVCQVCKRPGHDALRCWYRFDNAYQSEDIPTALAAMHLEDSQGQDWYPDTGASAHVTADTGILYNSLKYNGPDTVMIGNGSRLPITSIGHAYLHTQSRKLPLNDVLVVPTIAKNLLSVSKLTEDYPCSFIFDNNGVYLKDHWTNSTVKIGQKDRGLYRVDSSMSTAFFTHVQKSVGEDVWHHRLAHTNLHTLRYLQNKNLIHCHSKAASVCESCQLAKSSALPFPVSDSISSAPLAKIHCDVWGPSPVTSFQNFRFYVIFVDDHTRYSWLYPMKQKSELFDIFFRFQQFVETQFEQKIKIFQCDGGGEFTSHKFQTHLQNCGIHQQLSCPYTPAQNGISERKHRHVVELGLAMLFHAKMPLTFWVDAFVTATYIINILPMPKFDMQTPHNRLYKHPPVYKHLRVFGCCCFPCLRPYVPNKLAPRSIKCVFLGYSPHHKGYRCLVPATGRVYISRHVVFDEHLFPFSNTCTTASSSLGAVSECWTSILPHSSPQHVSSVNSQPTSVAQSSSHISFPVIQSSSCAIPAVSPFDSSSSTTLSASPSPVAMTSPVAVSSEPGPISVHPMQTRQKSGITKPNPRYVCLAQYSVPSEPRSVKSALAHERWYKAMQALDHNNTWVLVPRLPTMNVVGCKWVFKAKLTSAGTLDRLKARLVAKGFHQEEGIDFTETFSPVVKHATIRLVLSVALSNQWSVHQLDVKNAFLHGNLTEQVYMEQPPGFVNQHKSDFVCLLKRSLYGLRQAPRAWFEKFSSYLLEFGFFCSTADPSLFVYRKGTDLLLLLLYVDDIVLTGSSTLLIADLITALSSQFSMKDLGPLHYFLGIEVHSTASGLLLSQTKYALDLLHRASMVDCKPVSTPLALKNIVTTTDHALLSNPHEYRSLVGGLQYLTITRPDIAYATNTLCQHLQTPTVGDFHKLKRVLHYVKGTLFLGLSLQPQSSLALSGFADADWAGCSVSRRSTTGFCSFLGSNLISWSAKRQPTVSRSSTEAEYRALASASADLTWLSFLLQDIGISMPAPTSLYCDNKSAIALTANPVLHARTKHIEIDYHFVREKVSSGSLCLRYIPSGQQIADLFTKSLPRSCHTLLRIKLGLCFRSLPNLRGGVNSHEKSITTHEKTIAVQCEEDGQHDYKSTTGANIKSTCMNDRSSLVLKNRFDGLRGVTE